MPLLNLLKLCNSYHKLYRQLDILRIENFLPENKSVQLKKYNNNKQRNKQTETIMSTPKGRPSLEFLLNIFDMRFGRLVESQAIELSSNAVSGDCSIRMYAERLPDKLINLSNITSVKPLSGWEYKTKFHQVRSEKLCFKTWKYNYLCIHIQPPSHFKDQICWPSENSLSFVSERLRQTWQSRSLTDHPSITAKYKHNTNSRTLIIWMIIIYNNNNNNRKTSSGLIQDGLFTSWKLEFVFDPRLHELRLRFCTLHSSCCCFFLWKSDTIFIFC